MWHDDANISEPTASAAPPIAGRWTPDTVLKAGMAAGSLYSRGSHRHRVVIGKDTRLSGYMLEQALTAGLPGDGHGCVPVRPGADAGGRHADPLAPRRSRRDDLGLA